MSILYLGKAEPKILAELMLDDVTITAGELVEDYDYGDPTWVICNGYRHIIKWPFIERWYGRIINIHISLLPWNRGASPNLWSWFDDTPRGVSIHMIESERIDSGRVIAQCKVDMHNDLTLESSYQALQDVAADLFIDQWKYITMGAKAATHMEGVGSFHTVKQSEALLKQFKLKYKTKCICSVMYRQLGYSKQWIELAKYSASSTHVSV